MTNALAVHSDAVSGWAGWPLAYLEFEDPIPTIQSGGEDYAHQITACPPGFENPRINKEG